MSPPRPNRGQSPRRPVALVTGAARGLGLHAAVALADRGFVVLAAVRRPDATRPLFEALRRRGHDPDDPRVVRVVELDVVDETRVAGVFDEIERDPDLGALDVLVNNAGIMRPGFAELTSEAELREHFETNFFAVTRLTQHALPAMRARCEGKIINVSSIGGRIATPGHAAYHASKFALEGWSESLRAELAPWNVFVTLVEPGYFPTEIYGRHREPDSTWGSDRHPHGPAYRALGRGLSRELEALKRRMSWVEPAAFGQAVGKLALMDAPPLRCPVGIDAKISTWVGATSLSRLWTERMRAFGRGEA